MFGRLPRLHREVVIAVVLVTFTALGAWIFHRTPIPSVAGTGALVGLGLGCVLAFASVHQFNRHQPRAVRIRRR